MIHVPTYAGICSVCGFFMYYSYIKVKSMRHVRPLSSEMRKAVPMRQRLIMPTLDEVRQAYFGRRDPYDEM